MMEGPPSAGALVHLGLGSNIGDKAARLCEAACRLKSIGTLEALSSLYRTDPVGFADQDWFLNAAVSLRTHLMPREVLEAVLDMERKMGRIRTVKNGPRTIDIDLLLWGERVIDEPGLSLPHPRLPERLFVLVPLAEIAPGMRHPTLGFTMAALRDRKAGEGGVELYGAFPAIGSV